VGAAADLPGDRGRGQVAGAAERGSAGRAAQVTRIEIGRRGDPPSRPPVRGEPAAPDGF
jgi:hypothetical protein